MQKYEKDCLEDILLLATVVVQKGRPKGTKRDKLGVEHEDDKIVIERKEEVKRRKVKYEEKKKDKKLTVTALKTIQKK